LPTVALAPSTTAILSAPELPTVALAPSTTATNSDDLAAFSSPVSISSSSALPNSNDDINKCSKLVAYLEKFRSFGLLLSTNGSNLMDQLLSLCENFDALNSIEETNHVVA
jgi:hypothetical protein